MSVSIVRSGPSRRGRARVALERAAGAVLLVVAALLTIPNVWIPIVWVLQLLSTNDGPLVGVPPAIRSRLLPIWLAMLTLWLVARFVGTRLVRRNRRLVLYLRRFGNTRATETVRDALRSIGGSWRLVTLDDDEVDPVGVDSTTQTLRATVDRWRPRVQKWRRRGVRIAIVIGVIAGIGALLSATVEFLLTGGDAQQRFDIVVLSADGTVDGGPGASALRFFVAILLFGAFVGSLAVLLALLYLALMPVAGLLDDLNRGIEAAETRKRLTIADKPGVQAALRTIRPLARSVFAPRLIVVKVANAVWQHTVVSLAIYATVALVDVSQPSENVWWEVDALTFHLEQRCVFVGQEEQLAYLTSPAEPGSYPAKLQQRLDGRRVLAYSGRPADAKQFAKALGAVLDFEVRTTPAFSLDAVSAKFAASSTK